MVIEQCLEAGEARQTGRKQDRKHSAVVRNMDLQRVQKGNREMRQEISASACVLGRVGQVDKEHLGICKGRRASLKGRLRSEGHALD
eukprot:1137584-Pelagomonas_calceolata.AAC.1